MIMRIQRKGNLDVYVDVLDENAVLEVGGQVRYALNSAEYVAVHGEAYGTSTDVTQRCGLRPVAHVAREINVKLESEMVDLVVSEVVAC